jgi:hypothetical protein
MPEAYPCQAKTEPVPSRREQIYMTMKEMHSFGAEMRRMAAAQAQKRAGLRFVASRVISGVLPKLGEAY